jgi:hypothetical protein
MSIIGGPGIVLDGLELFYCFQTTDSYRGDPITRLEHTCSVMTSATGYRPFTSAPHSTYSVMSSSMLIPETGMPVWKIKDSSPDNYSRWGVYNITGSVFGYDKTFIASAYVYIPSGVTLSTSVNRWVCQNNTGVEWHSGNYYPTPHPTYGYFSKDIKVAEQLPNTSLRDTWQRIWLKFTTSAAARDYPGTASCTKINFMFSPSLVGQSGSNYFYVSSLQVHEGSYIQPYSHTDRDNTVAGGGGLIDIAAKNNISISLPPSMSYDEDGPIFNNTPTVISASGGLLSLTDDGNSHTYECWYKPLGDTPNAYAGYIFGRAGWHTGFYQVNGSGQGNKVGTTGWYSDNTAFTAIGGTQTLTLNTWNHLVMVFDEQVSASYGYINGNLVGSLSLTKPLKNYGSAPYFIGGSGTYCPYAQIQNVKLYSKALSPSEVVRNYNAQRGWYGR